LLATCKASGSEGGSSKAPLLASSVTRERPWDLFFFRDSFWRSGGPEVARRSKGDSETTDWIVYVKSNAS
jgi:hypothetical protein